MIRTTQLLVIVSLAHFAVATPATAQWYINPGAGNMGNGPMGGNPGPASSMGAGPIGQTQPRSVGAINSGGPFGGGSITANSTLNGAVSNGNFAGGGTGGLGTGSVGDALLYGGAYGGYGGYGGGMMMDPISNYASAQYNGMSNLLRAYGSYTVDESEALMNTERARTRYIDNEQKIYHARHAFKRMKMTQVAEQRENDKATRDRREEFIDSHRPRPLSQEHLDPNNGSLQWPTALRASEFDEYRTSLDELFAQQVKGYDRSATNSKINQAVQDMRDLLRSQILTIPLQDYSEARQFLDSMAATVK